MAKILRWELRKITEMIVLTLLNKYDFMCMIEGSRGTGKSTLSLVLSRRVSRVFTKLKRFDEVTVNYYWEKVSKQVYPEYEDFVKKLWELKEEKAYEFKMRKSILYTRDKIISFLHTWHGIALADEFVLAGFNRDFYNEEQKNLIKIINTNRDHNHCLFCAIPSFNNLDTQIKGLTKIRLTVLRRGLALIQTPNRSFFSNDRWDTAYNQRLEQDWLKKKVRNPHYGKLTTVRGMLTFPDISERLRGVYEDVKTRERIIIAEEQFGITENGDKSVKLKPHQMLANQLLENGLKNKSVIEGYALANDIKCETLIKAISRELTKLGKNPRLTDYYWDSIRKNKADKTADKTSNKEKELPLREGEDMLAYEIRTK